MPDVSLNGIEFQIKGSTGAASSSIDNLIKKLGALNNALSGATNVKALSKGLNGLKKALDGLNQTNMKGATSALKELSKVSEDLQGLANMSKDLASFARAMTKLSEKPEQLLNVASALEHLGQVDLSNLAAASESMRAFAEAMNAINRGGSQPVQETVSAWQRLTSAVGGFARSGLSKFGQLMAFPFKGAAKSATSFAKSLMGTVGGFKRILGYRIIRAIIKQITQAFSEGIKNLYGWSKAVGGATISGKNFAQTMDGLATSSAYFKNSIGAAIAPLISALAPAIDFVIDKVVALINVINQLLALLGGATSWNKATRKAQEFEQAAGGAGGAAKEALRYLAPFDELNRLPSDKNGGGGGGGTDYDGMFEEQTEFLEGLKDFTDNVKAAVEAGDWEGLGVIIGDKFNEIIDKINWSGIGTKIGEKVNALFTTTYWTLKTINFQNIGASVAELLTGDDGIGGALREIDFTNIGGIIANKFTVLPEMLVGAINKLDFSVVGQKFGETFRGFFDHISDSIDGVDWNATVQNLMSGLIDAIKGFDLTSALNSLGKLASSLADAIKEVDWATVVDDIFTGIIDIVKNLDTSGLITGVMDLLGSVAGAVAASIGTVVADVAEAITNPDTWALVGAWLKDLPAQFKQAGITAVNSLVQPIIDGFNNFVDNHPDLAKKLGLEHIEFELIPSLSEEELHKNYNAAKEKLETDSKKSPVDVTSTASLVEAKNNFPSDKVGKYGRLLVPASANIQAWRNTLPTTQTGNNGRLLLPTSANLQKFRNSFPSASLDSSNRLMIKSRADLVRFQRDFPSANVDSNNRLVIPSKADLVRFQRDFPEAKLDANGRVIIPSLANLTKREIGFSTTFAAVANFLEWLNNLGTPSVNSQAKMTTWANGLSSIPVINVKGNVTSYISAVKTGGVLNHGVWSSIPKYAKGTTRAHGSLFVAGEAGPEVVGHVGGRTEVLNRSQMAATMYAAVKSAMSSVNFNVYGGGVSAPMPSDSTESEEMLYRAFSRALADSDLGGDIELDGGVLYSKMVQRNRLNTRLTGVNAMA